MLHVCYMTIIYILGKGGGAVPHVLVPKNTFTDVFDNTRDIFCLQTTQELPNKHDEAGSPEDNDLPTGANCHKSITNTLDTVKGQTLWRLLVPMSNAKGILENLSRGIRMANWEMSAPRSPSPTFKKLHRLRSGEQSDSWKNAPASGSGQPRKRRQLERGKQLALWVKKTLLNVHHVHILLVQFFDVHSTTTTLRNRSQCNVLWTTWSRHDDKFSFLFLNLLG